jgi:aryl-alcohol dehydrogenase-like predicted oxidoreductase
MMNRKEFLEQLVALTGGLMVPSFVPQSHAGEVQNHAIPRRKLGSTDVPVTVLGLGGFDLGAAANEKDAREVIDTALEEGIRFFDNAESYQEGRSERWLGAGLKGVRKNVFLMTKTFSPVDRSAESAKRHLEGSLERLQTDFLDLWQLHAIKDVEDVERSFREGGAMQYILEMQRKGVVKHVGVTGHANPAAHRRALEFWDEGWKFDTMQFPLNPVDFHQLSFQHEVLTEAVKRGIAVLAMKTAGRGSLIEQEVCTAEECRRYVLSLPISVAIVGMETPNEVHENARIFRNTTPLTPEQSAALLDRVLPQVDLKLESYKAPSPS